MTAAGEALGRAEEIRLDEYDTTGKKAETATALALVSIAGTLGRIEELLRPTVEIDEPPPHRNQPTDALFELPVDQDYAPDPSALRRPFEDAIDRWIADDQPGDEERLLERLLTAVVAWSTGSLR